MSPIFGPFPLFWIFKKIAEFKKSYDHNFLPKKAQMSKKEKIRKVHRTLLTIQYWSTVKNFSLTFCAKLFSWLLHMYIDPQKKFGRKTQCKNFHGGPLLGGDLRSGTL